MVAGRANDGQSYRSRFLRNLGLSHSGGGFDEITVPLKAGAIFFLAALYGSSNADRRPAVSAGM